MNSQFSLAAPWPLHRRFGPTWAQHGPNMDPTSSTSSSQAAKPTSSQQPTKPAKPTSMQPAAKQPSQQPSQASMQPAAKQPSQAKPAAKPASQPAAKPAEQRQQHRSAAAEQRQTRREDDNGTSIDAPGPGATLLACRALRCRCCRCRRALLLSLLCCRCRRCCCCHNGHVGSMLGFRGLNERFGVHGQVGSMLGLRGLSERFGVHGHVGILPLPHVPCGVHAGLKVPMSASESMAMWGSCWAPCPCSGPTGGFLKFWAM
jgi:hypothetical protein